MKKTLALLLLIPFMSGCSLYDRWQEHRESNNATEYVSLQHFPVIYFPEDEKWSDENKLEFAQALWDSYYHAIPCLMNAYDAWLPEKVPYNGNFSISEIRVWNKKPTDPYFGMIAFNGPSGKVQVWRTKDMPLRDVGAFSWEIRNGFRFIHMSQREHDPHPGDAAAQLCVEAARNPPEDVERWSPLGWDD